jgi:hypothetical protein
VEVLAAVRMDGIWWQRRGLEVGEVSSGLEKQLLVIGVPWAMTARSIRGQGGRSIVGCPRRRKELGGGLMDSLPWMAWLVVQLRLSATIRRMSALPGSLGSAAQRRHVEQRGAVVKKRERCACDAEEMDFSSPGSDAGYKVGGCASHMGEIMGGEPVALGGGNGRPGQRDHCLVQGTDACGRWPFGRWPWAGLNCW